MHGHSSHHPKLIEVYKGRLILCGCGDFINNDEGIGGYEAFRSGLVLMYLAEFAPSGNLAALDMVPFRIERFRLTRAPAEDCRWLADVLTRESLRFGCHVVAAGDHTLSLSWRS